MSRVGFADETRIEILMTSDETLLRKVRSKSSLVKAWMRIRANGMQSESIRTKRDIEIFSEKSDLNLSRLYRSLLQGDFAFSKAKGVPLRRPGKTARPIVIASVKDRIVQRSILDVLQGIPAVSEYINIPTSFGGLENRGTKQAFATLASLIKSENLQYFAKSDIKDFFRGIPKETVISKIKHLIGDHQKFLDFLRSAVDVELENINRLGSLAHLFPSKSIGVAQGCSLSPLFGNILLHDFDIQLNGRGIVCLRYIDDFVILGKELSSVRKAYRNALQYLQQHGLSAHEPSPRDHKASEGSISSGFEFLGCKIVPGLITPNEKSKHRLLDNIRARVDQSKRHLPYCHTNKDPTLSFCNTIIDINRSIFNWANQYSFCNDNQSFYTMQKEINAIVRDYISFFRSTIKASNETKLFRSIGLNLLIDSNYDPIKW